MGQLTNQYVSQSYQGLIKLEDSTQGVTSNLQNVQDGLGNNLPIKISSTDVTITGSFYGDGSGLTGITFDTGSLVTTSSFNSFTSSIDGRVDSLEQSTGSYATTSSLITLSGSIASTDLSQDNRLSNLEITTGSLQLQINSKLDTGSFNVYTSSNDSKVNSLINATGSYATTSSLTTLSGSIATTDLGQDNRLNSIETTTGSLQLQVNSKLDTGSFNVYTSSNDTKVNDLISKTGSYVTETESGSFVTSVTGVTDTITITKGNGTNNTVTVNNVNNSVSSSQSDNSISSSFAQNAISSSQSQNSVSASQAQNAVTASFAMNVTPVDLSYYATTGSNVFQGNQTITGSVDITGTITATSASFTYVTTTYETASIIYSSGSNQFGDASNDVQTLWGTVNLPSGPLSITGSVVATSFTGSLQGNATTATSASQANNSVSASFAQNAISSSQSQNSVSSSQSQNSVSASQANNSNLLNGISSSLYARRNTTNTFTADQTIQSGSKLITNLIQSDSNEQLIILSDGNVGSGDKRIIIADTPTNPGDPYGITSVVISGSLQVTNGITGSLQGNASSATTATNVGGYNAAALAKTGSNTFNGNQTITGSVTSTVGFTGSLEGTASYATNALSASYAPDTTNTSSLVTSVTGVTDTITVTKGDGTTNTVTVNNVNNSVSASQAQNAVTASFAMNVSPVDLSYYATTGSNRFNGNQRITGSVQITDAFNNATLAVTGSIIVSSTLQTNDIQQNTNSSLNITNNNSVNSSIFLNPGIGANLRDVIIDAQNQNRGLKVSGSIKVNNAVTASFFVGDGSQLTNLPTISVDTGSFVTTSSFNSYTGSNDSKVNSLINATGSYATTSSLTALSSSIASTDLSQDNRLGSLESTTGSLQLQINSKLNTGSFNVYTSSNDSKVNSLISQTGSYVTETESGSFVVNVTGVTDTITIIKGDDSSSTITIDNVNNATSASQAQNAVSSSFSINSTSSSFAENATSASQAQNSISSSFATNATSSSFATNAISASFAQNAVSSSYSNYAVTSSVSEDLVIRGKNDSITTLTKGTIVRITGNVGANPLFNVASWENDGSSANTIGMLNSTVAPNGFADIITTGKVVGINTNGMTAGQILYLSSSGQYTTIQPVAPYHEVRLGQVLIPQLINGSAYISVDNGYELSELHDVDITAPVIGDVLTYVSGTYGQWVNKTGTELGYASTGSNTFNGTQIITGSLYVTDTLYATSASFTYVTSSQIVVSGNTIAVNIGVPAQRFGGLVAYDSGSSSATASLLWDSQKDHWVYENVSGSLYSGAGLISGPRNTGSLGDEPYPTLNTITRGQGSDHIYDSNITDDDTVITMKIKTDVSGSLSVTNGITGSLEGNATTATSASHAVQAISSSQSDNSISSSFAQNALSASYAVTASYSPFAEASVTASYALNANVDTSSLATTGSNKFNGSQIITGSLTTRNNSIFLTNNNALATSSLFGYVTQSVNASNIFFAEPIIGNNVTQSLSISSSNNIIFNRPEGNTNVFDYRIIGVSGSNIISVPPRFTKTSTGSFVNANFSHNITRGTTSPFIIDLPTGVTTGSLIISNNYVAGAVTYNGNQNLRLPQIAQNNVIGSITYNANVAGYNTGSNANPNLTGNYINGGLVLNARSGSIVFNTNNVNGTVTINNNYTATGSGGYLNINNNNFGGTPTISIIGSSPLNLFRSFNNNLIQGSSITIAGRNELTSSGSLANSLIVGTSLTVTSSHPDNNNNFSSTFLGKFNSTGSYLSDSTQTIFAIGTGESNTTRRTSLHVSSSGLFSVRDSVNISGSVNASVGTLSIAATTSSLDLNTNNFFTLQLPSGSSTHISPTNIKPGQTINLLLNTTGSAVVTFPSSVKQPNGAGYVPTATTGQDILTLVSFDSTNLYVVAVKNLI